MKHKNVLLFAILVLALACAGCGQQDPSDTVPPAQAENRVPEVPEAGTDENPSNADKLFEISNLRGAVTEFSEDGCELSPTIDIDDNLCYGAAPGYEDTFVSVVYNPDCTFQIAHVDIQTAAATYEPATVKDVKKQTDLILCGEYDENDIFHASRVFIHRTEGM